MVDDQLTSLLDDVTATVTDLNRKVREAITMGKPGEAADYAASLNDACEGYYHLRYCIGDDD